MKTRTKLFAAIVMAFAAQSAMAGFEYNGYLRSGSGSGSKGGGATCYRLQGTSALGQYNNGSGNVASAGRLGNECDTYGEIMLANTGESDGTKFGVHTLMAFGTQQAADYEQSIPAWREAYTSAEGFGNGAFAKAKVWAGKRYYNRKDVHVVDLFWLQVTGPGAGVENIDVGVGKFSYAWLRAGNVNYLQLPTGCTGNATSVNCTTDNQQLARVTTLNDPTQSKSNHDFRLEGINLGKVGSLSVGTNIIRANNNSGGTNLNGWSAWAMHSKVFGTIQNSVIAQTAHGSGSLDGAGLWWATAGNPSTHTAWRVIDSANFEVGEHVNGAAFIAYGKEKFPWADDTDMSMVVRPIYHFTENLSLAVEAGRTQAKNNSTGNTNHLNKLTIAPQISMGSGFYSRPVLRAYVTYASWNQGGAVACTGRDCLVNISSFGNATSGASYGVQMESWW